MKKILLTYHFGTVVRCSLSKSRLMHTNLHIKPHVTERASDVLDASVPNQMYLQIAGLRELLAALGASEVLLVRVRL